MLRTFLCVLLLPVDGEDGSASSVSLSQVDKTPSAVPTGSKRRRHTSNDTDMDQYMERMDQKRTKQINEYMDMMVKQQAEFMKSMTSAMTGMFSQAMQAINNAPHPTSQFNSPFMMPQGMTRQGMTPQGMTPQGMTPQGMMPQGMMPQGMMQQGMMPQGMMPQGPELTTPNSVTTQLSGSCQAGQRDAQTAQTPPSRSASKPATVCAASTTPSGSQSASPMPALPDAVSPLSYPSTPQPSWTANSNFLENCNMQPPNSRYTVPDIPD